MIRIDPERGLVTFALGLRVPGGRIGHAQPEMAVGMAWIQLNRFLQRGQSILDLVFSQVAAAEIVERFSGRSDSRLFLF